MQLTLERAAEHAKQLRDLPIRRRASVSAQRAAKPSNEERFWRFHSENPHVYDLLVRLARKVQARGKAQYSMKAIFEQARWFYHIEQGNEDFKLNNNLTSHYARLIMAQEADLKDFFEKRRLRSE